MTFRLNSILPVFLTGFLVLQSGWFNLSFGQKTVFLKNDSDLPSFLEQKKVLKDSQSVASYSQDFFKKLYENGYWEASIDSTLSEGDSTTLFLHTGPPYQWIYLKNGNIEPTFSQTTGFREKSWIERPFQPEAFYKLQSSFLKRAGELGFPFARIYLDSLLIFNGNISGNLFLEKGPFVQFEDLEVEGNLKLSKKFLARYLGIQESTPYNSTKVLKIKNRLAELPYVKVNHDPVVVFGGTSAKVGLVLDKKEASHFDFIIGVLPQNQETGRLLITGSFTGEMQNQFGLGERIYANYEQLRPETRELNLAFNYPYVLQSPFGVDASFGLYKRDTSYLDINFNVGIQYLLEGGNYVKFFWQEFQSNLLTFDTSLVVNQKILPNPLDINRQDLGVELLWNKTDYRFNPRKGFYINLKVTAGLKTIRKNNQILSLQDPQDADYDFNQLYDTLDLSTYQGRWAADLAWYIPTFSSHTIKMGLRGSGILSETPVYLNEQYRIGGNALLRGFDEEAIFSTHYLISTLEYRILTGQNSYLFAFFDGAVTRNFTRDKNETDYPIGFGAGLTFETQAGIFGLSYALGRQQGNPIDFRAGKIHFGYVSLF
jgi:outer membrane protein assembly factor BamA